jgi:hypothetical protein
MNRKHALVIAVLLGVAAVAGTFAALETTALGVAAQESSVSTSQIAARKAKLDKAQKQLQRAAKRKPPAQQALLRLAAPSQRPQSPPSRRPRAAGSFSRLLEARRARADRPTTTTTASTTMTNHVARLYLVALALVVFFLTWVVVAACPWATTATAGEDPRLAALERREARLRRQSVRVQRLVNRRFARYVGETTQWMDTSLRNQPFSPGVPVSV